MESLFRWSPPSSLDISTDTKLWHGVSPAAAAGRSRQQVILIEWVHSALRLIDDETGQQQDCLNSCGTKFRSH